MSGLSVTVDVESRVPTVTVAGEIDLSNVVRLAGELARATAPAGTGLVVDLAGVTYLDSAGIGELFNVAARLDGRGGALAVAVPDGSPLRRLLKITRFEDVAAVCPSCEAAITVVAARSSADP